MPSEAPPPAESQLRKRGLAAAALRVATKLAPMVQLADEMKGEDEEMHSRLISEWTVGRAALERLFPFRNGCCLHITRLGCFFLRMAMHRICLLTLLRCAVSRCYADNRHRDGTRSHHGV